MTPPTPKPPAEPPPAPSLPDEPAADVTESRLQEVIAHVSAALIAHRTAVETAVKAMLGEHGDASAKALDELDGKVKYHLDQLRQEWDPLKTEIHAVIADLRVAVEAANKGDVVTLEERVRLLEEDMIGMAAKVGRAIGATDLLRPRPKPAVPSAS